MTEDSELMNWHDRFLESFIMDTKSSLKIQAQFANASLFRFAIGPKTPQNENLTINQPLWVYKGVDKKDVSSLDANISLWIKNNGNWLLLDPYVKTDRIVFWKWYEIDLTPYQISTPFKIEISCRDIRCDYVVQ